MDNERYVVAVHMVVSIEASDFDDAKDKLEDIFGPGDDEFGVACLNVNFEPVGKE